MDVVGKGAAAPRAPVRLRAGTRVRQLGGAWMIGGGW